MAIKNAGTQGSGNTGAKGKFKKDKDFDLAVTAEIPQVQPKEVYSLQLPLSPGARRHQKRKPAPFAVRALVWFLVFLVLLGLGGIWIEHVHSGWFASLRNTVSGTGTTQSRSTGRQTTGSQVKQKIAYGTVAYGKNEETIAVPISGYDINIVVDKPCWVKIYSPAGSSNILFEQVLPASQGTKTLQITGSSRVTFGAVPVSFSITSGSTTVFKLSSPKVLPFQYIFSTK
ncbi:MAG: hypothetical protein M1374_00045 [Firmicutes bacterium]|nr:hypothetical protein [Bacillota bacterium]